MAPKNEKKKAMCLLTAWMESVGVKYEKPAMFGTDLRVTKRDGTYLDVVVGIAANDNTEMTNIVCVSASDITNRNREIGMFVIKSVLKAAGYGDKKLMDRGAEPVLPEGRKRLYGEDLDLSVMRHNQFRQVPNPPAYVYKELGNVIKTCATFFHNNNQELCRRLGFSMNDLKTYAMLWTANFWGTGRVIWPEGDDNERLLYSYLRQRFSELYQQMRGPRMRNTIPDQSSINAGFDLEFAFDDSSERDGLKQVAVSRLQVVRDEEAELRAEQIQIERESITDRKRRKAAVTQLETGLAAMPHDSMVASLEQVAGSLLACPDARKEARKRLAAHKETCLACAPAEVTSTVIHGYTLRIQKAANESTVDAGSKTA